VLNIAFAEIARDIGVEPAMSVYRPADNFFKNCPKLDGTPPERAYDTM
jgi:hypothetical protein